MNALDWISIAPALMLAAFGLIVLLLGAIADRAPKGRLNHFLPPEYLSLALITPTAVMSALALWSGIKFSTLQELQFVGFISNMIKVDTFGTFFGFIAVIGTLIVMVMSLEYFGDHNTRHRSEYFALLFFATSAITLVAVSADLLMLYLSLEFLSLSSYILAAYWKNDTKSSEAGIKYFLFGAISSAVMLYGMSMLFGIAHSTNLQTVALTLKELDPSLATAVMAAVVMILAGIGFKLALVPFHLWAPDTYEGAPTPITAWLSVASKAAGLAIVARFLLVGVPIRWGVDGHPQPGSIDWFSILIILSAASMTLGNLIAITQKNIKRMLAYSSIAQVGYMLVGILAAVAATKSHVPVSTGDTFGTSNYGLTGFLIYAASYLFMNLGAFAVVIALERQAGSSEIISFAGLGKKAPILAASLVIFFLSLAGIPPTAGFIGKFYVFAGAIQTGRNDLLTLALIAIANSVVSVFYYFNVVRLMYMKDAEAEDTLYASTPLKATVIAMAVITVGICLAAAPVIWLAKGATF